MTRKLEEEFNLPHMDEVAETPSVEQTKHQIQTVEDALSVSEKINMALAEVRGMEAHDSEMDEIAQQAVESYEQLMSLGMNMTDMAAGPVFNNAANMLKIALEAKDSKTTRKLKQIDLMLKKARLDQQSGKDTDDNANITAMDRNELLKMLGKDK
jgi:hypothetical protein